MLYCQTQISPQECYCMHIAIVTHALQWVCFGNSRCCHIYCNNLSCWLSRESMSRASTLPKHICDCDKKPFFGCFLLFVCWLFPKPLLLLFSYNTTVMLDKVYTMQYIFMSLQFWSLLWLSCLWKHHTLCIYSLQRIKYWRHCNS